MFNNLYRLLSRKSDRPCSSKRTRSMGIEPLQESLALAIDFQLLKDVFPGDDPQNTVQRLTDIGSALLFFGQ